MTLILYLIQYGRTPLYKASSNGHDKVVKALLDHGVQVDIPDKVSDHIMYSCNTTEVNKLLLISHVISKNDAYILSLFSYDFNYGISIQHITL